MQGYSGTREPQEHVQVLEAGIPKSEEARESLAGLPKASAIGLLVCFSSLVLILDICGIGGLSAGQLIPQAMTI